MRKLLRVMAKVIWEWNITEAKLASEFPIWYLNFQNASSEIILIRQYTFSWGDKLLADIQKILKSRKDRNIKYKNVDIVFKIPGHN